MLSAIKNLEGILAQRLESVQVDGMRGVLRQVNTYALRLAYMDEALLLMLEGGEKTTFEPGSLLHGYFPRGILVPRAPEDVIKYMRYSVRSHMEPFPVEIINWPSNDEIQYEGGIGPSYAQMLEAIKTNNLTLFISKVVSINFYVGEGYDNLEYQTISGFGKAAEFFFALKDRISEFNTPTSEVVFNRAAKQYQPA